MAFDLSEYKTVSARIADFKAKHPEGCLRPADLENPYRIVEVEGSTFIVFVAAAYRTPDDPCPGIGVAWERFPGPTTYTRDSELQNAETSAWGRSIVAVLASESKNIASADDVQNRRSAEAFEQAVPAMTSSQATAIATGIEHLSEEAAVILRQWWKERGLPKLDSKRLTQEQAESILGFLPIAQAEADVAAGAVAESLPLETT